MRNGIAGPGKGVRSLETNKIVLTKNRKLTPEQMRLYEFRKQRLKTAIELRIAGASYRQIVEANIGYTNMNTVSKDIQRAFREAPVEGSLELVLYHVRILEDWFMKYALQIRQGHLEHIPNAKAILKDIRVLLGINDETIHQKNDGNTITNNGVMVISNNDTNVNNDNRKFESLRALMIAANASQEEIEQQVELLKAKDEIENHPSVEENEILEETTTTVKRIRIKHRSHQINEDSTIVAPRMKELNRSYIDIEDAEIIDVDPEESDI